MKIITETNDLAILIMKQKTIDRSGASQPVRSIFDCPFCFENGTKVFEKSGYPVFECTGCFHRYCATEVSPQHVEELYSDDYFSGDGDGYDDYLSNRDSLIARGQSYAKVLDRFSSGENLTILDVGSAAGFLQAGFEKQGWTSVGVEPNEKMAKFARDEFGVEVHTTNFEKLELREAVDAVSMIQVLPHLSDPRTSIQSAFDSLKPGGLLLVETWDFQSLTAKMFGTRWHEYNPPSVLHWFSRRGLSTLLEREGFEVLAKGRPTKWINVGHGVGLVRYSLRDSTIGMVASSPLKLVPKGLKVPYFLDDIFWMVARKI